MQNMSSVDPDKIDELMKVGALFIWVVHDFQNWIQLGCSVRLLLVEATMEDVRRLQNEIGSLHGTSGEPALPGQIAI